MERAAHSCRTAAVWERRGSNIYRDVVRHSHWKRKRHAFRDRDLHGVEHAVGND